MCRKFVKALTRASRYKTLRPPARSNGLIDTDWASLKATARSRQLSSPHRIFRNLLFLQHEIVESTSHRPMNSTHDTPHHVVAYTSDARAVAGPSVPFASVLRPALHLDSIRTQGGPHAASIVTPAHSEPTGLSGTGLAPVPASYAKQAALLSAPLGSNVGIQLEPELEPIFPPAGGEGTDFHLEGDLEHYIYQF
ncbi:hypothetical protein FB451DRAFT_1169218 [Mycena latifolia]|nr:hypothetical protein FB451DRAFT_1169218 [Mycena latifolia]